MRTLRAHQRLEALQGLLPEQASQDGIDVQRQQFLLLEAACQQSDPLVGILHLLPIVHALDHAAGQIAHALPGQALNQQAGRQVRVGGQYQTGFQLLAL